MPVLLLAEIGAEPAYVFGESGGATVQPDQVVLRARNGSRTIELRWAEMQRRLRLELADLSAAARPVDR
ncbi:MAG: hypothetical protein ACT4NY_11850 [Pseudonocardiales bacterium]